MMLSKIVLAFAVTSAPALRVNSAPPPEILQRFLALAKSPNGFSDADALDTLASDFARDAEGHSEIAQDGTIISFSNLGGSPIEDCKAVLPQGKKQYADCILGALSGRLVTADWKHLDEEQKKDFCEEIPYFWNKLNAAVKRRWDGVQERGTTAAAANSTNSTDAGSQPEEDNMVHRLMQDLIFTDKVLEGINKFCGEK